MDLSIHGRRMADAGRACLGRTVRAGALLYERERMLARLVAVTPDEVADRSLPGQRRLVERLARALREERRRGQAGHWTYDLNRHIGLMQALAAERRLLRALRPANREEELSPPPLRPAARRSRQASQPPASAGKRRPEGA